MVCHSMEDGLNMLTGGKERKLVQLYNGKGASYSEIFVLTQITNLVSHNPSVTLVGSDNYVIELKSVVNVKLSGIGYLSSSVNTDRE